MTPNGETKFVIDKLIELHSDNKNITSNILKELETIKINIAELPCKVHVEKMKGISGRINLLYWVMGTVVIGGIVFGIWIKIVMAG